MSEVIAGLENRFELLIGGVLVFSIGLAVVEFFWEIFTGKLNRPRVKEILASFSPAVPASILEALTSAAMVSFYLLVYNLLPWKWEPSWWTLLGALVLVDFIHYWTHRLEHRVRFFWAHHSTHHSSPIYNYSTAFRVSFMRAPFDFAYYLLPVALGFHPVLVLLSLGLVAVYQFWLHTEIIKRLGFLELVFMTPSHHRVHHGTQEKYLDKNYGAIIVLWDKLFGTFQKEEEHPVYGLTQQLNSVNPLRVHFQEYVNLFRDLKTARTAGAWLTYLFAPPGTKPPGAQSKKRAATPAGMAEQSG